MEVFEYDSMKKDDHNHPIQEFKTMEMTKSKSERGTKNMIAAQVRSGATVKQTMRRYEAKRLTF